MEAPKKTGFVWLSPIVHLSSNWISRIGVFLVTTAGVLWLFLLPATLRGEIDHPYLGILIFMVLPAAFFGGLILIPVGIVLRRRREREKGSYPARFPPLDFNNRDFRRLVIFVGAITIVNVVIGGQLTYSGIDYMDSVSFCGTTCHTVMQPEYTAYQNSPHARVACVQCHIGPGASWFVRSKLSGTQQVFAVLFNTYPRPIPVPVHNLRPARETCEACHWPARFEGNRLEVIATYADDEQNTLTKTVLLMHIGGGGTNGPGIHSAHVGPGIVIRYGSDESRQTIHWVEYQNTITGRKTLYRDPNTKRSDVNFSTARTMDCIDCHNRPTHIFQLPGRAMDQAMAAGTISPSLPYIKKLGLEVLNKPYPSRAAAEAAIPIALKRAYQKNYPDLIAPHSAEIVQAAKGLVAIYDRNVFPKMKITWGTYPNNLGHMDFPGCFRCHDSQHTSANNLTIPQDCSVCHNILAMEQSNPSILVDLGLAAATPAAGKQ